ncbi:RNA-guided endonuclease InsQ/TnpB family protein [Salinirussus salinus]|uniref:RNA-guided endonuclease InsQ/TnpB family protein n=1 Tax=Salinirussus salinus TaxID=1198300 RepID=UPI00135BFD06|nr:RNA-guided endonuclease TnpB family protein [Salinirussus salinus]
MVEESFQYHAEPASREVARRAWNDIQTCREVYNHALTQDYHPAPDGDKPSYTAMQNKLPDWKRQWSEWGEVYSKYLQMAVRRIKHGETVLDELETKGYDVGELKWKAPREYRSITYNQSGFDVDSNTGRANHATVDFSKIGCFHLSYHRPLPEDGTIKQIHLKKQKTGEWTVSIVVDYDPDYPDKPAVEDIEPEDCIGIDLGIRSFVHDSTGRAVDRLDLSDDRERLEREQRSLSRKQHGSKNWERQRRRVADVHQRMTDRKDDFKHKLAHFYTTECEAVFVEDLDVRGMLEGDGNARNKAGVGWRGFIRVLKRHGEKNGCHVVEVEPNGTTKECARCGVEVEKPLWVRTHSCPSCGFETDRDRNTALNAFSRGLEELGVVHSEDTPVETTLPTGTDSVPAKRVVEAGSPALKERTVLAVSE